MFRTIAKYLSLIRFSHTLFALPFALLATFMAGALRMQESPPRPIAMREWLGFFVCMAAARSAAMAFNRLADSKLDAANPRTAGRHLPSGDLTPRGVWAFFISSLLAFLGGAMLFWPNWLPVALAVPVLVILCGYSYAKRFTSLAHVWLGAALMLSPICAWIALRGEAIVADPGDLLPALLLGLGVLAWVSGFDIIYACQDEAFDRSAGLHSIPAALGTKAALRIAAALHAAAAVCFLALPATYPALGWFYFAGAVAAAGLMFYEHALVRPNDLSRVNQAFFPRQHRAWRRLAGLRRRRLVVVSIWTTTKNFQYCFEANSSN